MTRPAALETIFHYHQVTKHHFHGSARGPGGLDWATQPNPFRRHERARLVPLEKIPPTEEPLFDDAFVRGRIPPARVTARSISQLFYDSLALSAWKSIGENRWALRVNPSSGNLHPTEGYLLCGPIDGLCNTPMACHYAPKAHGLEVRAEFGLELWHALCARLPTDAFFVGLTSIHWREAWKYGQRAYRYCQHDAGHAIGVIGQVLYLEAEAAGIRSTGIGCYFDDPMHDVLGIKDRTFQDLYHFTIGGPVEDTRLTTLPAYPEE